MSWIDEYLSNPAEKTYVTIAFESPRAHWLRRALRQVADRFSVACCGVSEH